MLFGVSTWNFDRPQGSSGGNAVVAASQPSVWMGDSITAHNAQDDIASWTNFFMGGRLLHAAGYNQGVIGNTTAQMLARDSTALALNPTVYWILAGTNDIAVTAQTSATVIANLQSLIDHAKATASVKLIVIRTILKRAAPNDFTAGQRTTCDAVNAWIRAISDPMVKVIDYDLSAWDPTVNVHTDDGLHPNQMGAILLARYNVAQVASLFDATDVLLDKTGQLITNGDMAGTAGLKTASGTGATTTGVVADNWVARNFIAGVAAVCTKGTDALGNATQIITLNGTATANGNITFRNTTTYSGSTGEGYEMLAQLDITNGSSLGCILTGCDGVLNFGASGQFGVNGANQALSGVIRPGRSTLAGTDTSNDMTWNIYYPSGTVFINETLTLSRPIWRRTS